MILITEVIVFFNNYPEGFFNKVTPKSVKLFWGILMMILVSLFIYSYQNS